jgi:DNA-binding SARP family transcriptional activator
MTDHSILQARECAVDLSGPVISQSHRTADPPERESGQLTRILLLEQVALDTGIRQIVLRNRKATALIAYLALAPRMRETRERLIGLLWSETEPAKARASLRQSLYCLREVFEQEGLHGLLIDKLHVSLDQAMFTTDLEFACKTIEDGRPVELAINELCITDAILAGYDDVDPSFHAWLSIVRERIRRQMVASLERQLSAMPGRVEQTKRVAQALLEIDPSNEVASQHLMRAHIASGNTAGALAVYKQLWDYLEQAFDIEPSPVTQALVVSIRTGEYSPRMVPLVDSKRPYENERRSG